MHIDNDKLVGTYVSDRYSEKGTVTIVLTDGDSTPTREYTRYKYVQTEQLTAIGVAVKDYGAILVPETTLELFTNGTLNPTDFGVFVKFNDEYYSISLNSILAKGIADTVEFTNDSFDDYPTVTFNATLPPYSVGNAGQVPTVDENGKVGWDDIPEELPSVTGNTGKFLAVNDGGTGVEWKNVPNELPTIGSGDAGKVLKVNSEETGLEWSPIELNSHIYQHHVVITASGTYILFTILSDKSTKVTNVSTFLQIFDVSSGSSSMTGNECCSGRHNNTIVVGVDANGSSTVMLKLHTVSFNYSDGAITLSGITDVWLNMNNCTFTDTVKTLI